MGLDGPALRVLLRLRGFAVRRGLAVAASSAVVALGLRPPR